MKTSRLFAASAALLITSYAHASAPTTESTADWALRLANGEQQVTYNCTTRCQYVGREMVCTKSCW